MRAASAALFLLCATTALAASQDAVRVRLNGKPLALKTPALLREGKPWVPLDEISKLLGGHTKVIKPGKMLGLCLGETRCRPLRVGARDGAIFIKGTAFAPAQIIAEALDAEYAWDGKTRTAAFTKKAARPRRLPVMAPDHRR